MRKSIFFSCIDRKIINLGFHIGENRSNTIKNTKLNNYFISGIRNDFFVISIEKSIFFLKRSLTVLKVFNKVHVNNLFYLQSYSPVEQKLNFSFLKKHYLTVPGISFLDFTWNSGLVTNYSNAFLRFIKSVLKLTFNTELSTIHSCRVTINNKKLLHTLLLKLFFVLEEKSNLLFDIEKEFKSVHHLLRIVIFLRHWRSIFSIPDLLVFCRSDSYVKEFAASKIPTIGLVSTDDVFTKSITYPIPLNNSTILSSFFFFSIVFNIISKSKVCQYRSSFL